MAQRETLAVHGYKEFLKACTVAEPKTRKEVRESLRKVGDVVRQDAVRRFSPISTRSAAGYRTRVRQRGVAVQQSLKKTTGKHPEYGSLQMRKALLPALQRNADEVEREFERAIDRIADDFERRP